MSLWNVAVEKGSLVRTYQPSGSLAYKRVVRANTRQEALEKCIPDILKLTKTIDATIKYVSVYIGRKGSVTGAASRLWPIQITRDGKRRPQLR